MRCAWDVRRAKRGALTCLIDYSGALTLTRADIGAFAACCRYLLRLLYTNIRSRLSFM